MEEIKFEKENLIQPVITENIPKQPDKKVSKRLLVFIILSVLIVLGIIGSTIFIVINQGGDKEKIESNQAKGENVPLEVVKDFPFFSAPANVYFDPIDKNILWLSFSGAIIKYDLQKDTWELVLSGIKGLNNSPYSFLKKGDDFFFSLYQGGFEWIKPKTEERKIYDNRDGLPSNGNIKIYDDPYSDYIWIATFDGLSRFDTKSRTFLNLNSKPGFDLEINDIVVDKDYVWAVITANANNPGGIVRIDKTLGTWKEWGPKDFGSTDNRVDITGGLDAFGEKAIANVSTTGNLSGDKIVEYNPITEKWEELFARDGINYRNFTYLGDRIYFINNDYENGYKLSYLDRAKDDISSTKFAGSQAHIYRDNQAQRLVFEDWPNKIAIYDLKTDVFKELNFSQKNILVTRLIAADEENIVFTNGKDLIIRNLSDNSDKIISLPKNINENFEGAITGDKIVLFSNPQTEMGCGSVKVFIIDFKKGLTDKTININNYCSNVFILGKDTSEIFIGNYSYATQKIESIKRYIAKNNRFENQDVNFIDPTSFKYVRIENRGFARNLSGEFVADYSFDQIDSSNQRAKITIFQGSNIVYRIFNFSNDQIDAFGRPLELKVNAMVFDTNDQSKLLIGTNFGLIVFDVKTKEEYYLKTENGLISNNINKIISLKDGLVIEDNTGSYVYKIDYSKLNLSNK